jgi:predicted SprT family Zn-dependent metalloprotease
MEKLRITKYSATPCPKLFTMGSPTDRKSKFIRTTIEFRCECGTHHIIETNFHETRKILKLRCSVCSNEREIDF